MYAIPKESGTAAREMTAALDLSTGRTVWEDGAEVELLAKQESFSGSPMQPQATPVLDGGRLFTLGFTGIVQARDAGSGRQLWAADLVSEHGADPVQFGFAASPVIYEGRLLVHAGGAHAVIAFDPADGHVLWQSAAAAPSYATPTVLQWDGLKMVVQLTRDALFGFDLASGKTLWQYTLPKPGLTNVPTPIPLPGGRVLVSGQGLDGTRLLRLNRRDGTVAAEEIWVQPKAQFFYTNWAADEAAVYGFASNTGKRLTALSLRDGSVLWKESNQTDANVLLVGDRALVCRGDGLLSLGRFSRDGFKADARGRPVSGRCWAPPALVGGTLIVRSENELVATKLDLLSPGYRPAPDANTSALDRAFAGAEAPALVRELQTVLEGRGKPACLDRYQERLATARGEFSEGEFRALVSLAQKSLDPEAAERISADWVRAHPKSVAAFDALRKALTALGRREQIAELDAARLVTVRFVVRVKDLPEPKNLYLSGECAALGGGKPDGVRLAPQRDGTFGAEVKLPTGEYTFKVTRGTRTSTESNRHGGRRALRALSLERGSTIEFEVLGWVDGSSREGVWRKRHPTCEPPTDSALARRGASRNSAFDSVEACPDAGTPSSSGSHPMRFVLQPCHLLACIVAG
jgi:outer membrane protein assembly factor BamB